MLKEEFLDRCLKAAIKPGRHFRFSDVPWEDCDLVFYGGNGYVPEKLMIGFDRNGIAIYTARLRDVKANYSYLEARLSDIEGGKL